MRTLTFSLVCGYPNKMSQQEMLDRIDAMVAEVDSNLSKLPGVKFSHGGISRIYDKDKTPDQFDQVRCACWVKKEGRKVSWKTIMGEVNKTYAPNYRFSSSPLKTYE